MQGLVVFSFAAFGLTGGCEARETAMSIHETARPGVLAVDEGIGFWRVVSADGRAVCKIALDRFARDDRAGEYGVHIETCSVPALASAVGWRPVDGGFDLIGPAGQTVATFHRRGVDDFSAVEGGYRLERAPLA
jgi:hypothetical protein